MLRRLASLGHSASEDQLPMSPSPGDDQPPERITGGLAGVLKGLAGGSRLTKSPPPSLQSLGSIAAAQAQPSPSTKHADDSPLPTALRGLAPDQVEQYVKLKNRNGHLNERIAAATSLRYAIRDFPLNPVLDIWYAGKDLINENYPENARQIGWELLTECAKYTAASELERREYFETLTAPANRADFHLQLAALEDLTTKGRNITGFPYDIFPLLISWLHQTYQIVRKARRRALRGNGGSSKGKSAAAGEDKNFSQLFVLLRDVIKFNFKFARDPVVGDLMSELLNICRKTASEDDLIACINVIEALVTFGTIPNGKLKDCIKVLGTIHQQLPHLQKQSWHTISIICRSHHGQSTVRILLDILRTYAAPDDKEKEQELNREIRGALSVLKKLLHKSAEKGYPPVSLALLVDGLANVARSSNTKIAADTLQLINSLFDDARNNISPMVRDEHWSSIFEVAAQCGTQAVPFTAPDSESLLSPRQVPEAEDPVTRQLRRLITRIENLLTQTSDLLQRDECMQFLTQVYLALPDSAAGLVIAYFKDHRSCFPSDVEWKKNLDIIMDGFFLAQHRDPLTRLHALEIIIEVYDFLSLTQDLMEEDALGDLVRRLLSGMSEETNTLVLQDTVTFLVKVSQTADGSLFDDIIGGLREVVAKEMSRSPLALLASPKSSSFPPGQTVYFANQSLSNVVTRGYVQIFIRTLNTDGSKASKAFAALVHIARSNSCEVDARLTAMKMLFRLRADAEYQIYITTQVENESLAGLLYRTEASLARKLAEDAAHPSRLPRAEPATRPSRGISFTQGQAGEKGLPARQTHTPRPVVHQNQRLWSVPDADALPESLPERPSWLLISYRDENDAIGAELGSTGRAVLNMGAWLEAMISLFHNGCDWEVYSFVLAHLPAQLSNHPIFRGAIPHIHELRRFFCEMIKTGNFQEPPLSSGLRRSDVSNCLFHSLAMILSYHEHFQKMDEDDMVRTFTHGISDKTAKTCIHALQVCCHELPLSVSKALVTILQKMSQVITQPLVAVHILEFLACLSRLPSLYSNFREDEYRIIFGICARYLQSVRDKKQHAARPSHSSEPSTPSIVVAHHPETLGHQAANDDLPQYVYALAYHVITFWFLAVKLPDRPSHINWIAKNLFVDSDGRATNEEQAQVTLDFMQRVAFSDACDSAQDPLFTEEFYGEIQKRRWIIGNSIVTIRQAKETGWAEITRRYPSGTSSFAIRVEFSPMPNQPAADLSDASAWEGRFQHGITIFPSHLLMQLLAPMPQMYDPAIRPIPLPDDDNVNRAIRIFDRNSTVDGHKVGVIYVGEGQTKETEILANTIGSPEYLEFLKGLGVLTKLKGATFNTQGLDREYDTDGQYTYCWRDRVTEIVYHVTTQMPTNLERDPQCNHKKKHIGNDYVSIVWNESGLPFKFDTFPSQFNYVYIVITPAPRRTFSSMREMAQKRQDGEAQQVSPFFKVQVMNRPGFPEISPVAEPKLVSLKALPRFVRLIALNASVFSLVWSQREGGEHVSSWRNRLQEINRLRERHGPKSAHYGHSAGSTGLATATATAGGLPLINSSAAVSGTQSGLGGASVGAVGPGGMLSDYSIGGGGGPSGINSAGSRPASGNIRDSFSSLRRSSVATFFTSNTAATGLSGGTSGAGTGTGTGSGNDGSHRSSMLSTAASSTMMTDHGVHHHGQGGNGDTEALVDAVDFSKWT
ncbi:Tuberous sclerosis 2-like protein [Podospora pseudocomata]|uniref:Tuberous sclerosis 2-like protein n=1 Tax=Podospora pseudocomata TaxID=2093779 RepID=A0ABR0GNB1_9PEZI|nr:Tuberous sclerosis 2-like protein [Podospora pseudocomata]